MTRSRIFLITVLGLVAAVALGIVLERRMHPQPNGIVPYTVMLKKTQIVAGRSLTQITTEALRSDGSRADRIVVLTASGMPLAQRFVRYASGTGVTAFELTRLKSSVQVRADASVALRDPQQQCQLKTPQRRERFHEKVSGEEQVDGYRAVRIDGDRAPYPLWFALDYGCAPVRNMGSVIALTRGEPSPALFAALDDYKEVPPSAIFPNAPGDQDAYYYAHRPH